MEVGVLFLRRLCLILDFYFWYCRLSYFQELAALRGPVQTMPQFTLPRLSRKPLSIVGSTAMELFLTFALASRSDPTTLTLTVLEDATGSHGTAISIGIPAGS